MNESLMIYFNLCGAFGQILGYFCGAIILATFCIVSLISLYVFMLAFLGEVSR